MTKNENNDSFMRDKNIVQAVDGINERVTLCVALNVVEAAKQIKNKTK